MASAQVKMQGDSSQGNPANKTNPCQEVPSAALLLRGVVCGRASYPAHSEYLYHIFLGVLPALVHSTECSSRLDCCTRYSPCVAHAAPRCRISASKVTEQENRVGTMAQSSVPGQQQHLLTDEDDATAVPGKPRPRAAQVRGPQAPGPRSRDPLILLVILLRLKLAECSSWRGRWARLVVYQEWIPPPPIAPSLGPRPRARPRPVGSTRRLAPVPRAPLRLRFPFQRASVEQSQTKDRHSLSTRAGNTTTRRTATRLPPGSGFPSLRVFPFSECIPSRKPVRPQAAPRSSANLDQCIVRRNGLGAAHCAQHRLTHHLRHSATADSPSVTRRGKRLSLIRHRGS